jgi:cobalt/nickel transport system permease protein
VFTGIIIRSTLCLLTMVLLSNTTPFAALLDVLRRARVPAVLITTLALMYRYLFVLVDEAERMQRARQSRTFIRQRWQIWRNLAVVIGQLFVRSTERAERIYAAMLARGWR